MAWNPSIKKPDIITIDETEIVTFVLAGPEGPIADPCHWVDGEKRRCEGEDCSLCKKHGEPSRSFLLNVWDVDADCIRALRVSAKTVGKLQALVTNPGTGELRTDALKMCLVARRGGETRFSQNKVRIHMAATITDALRGRIDAAKKLDLHELVDRSYAGQEGGALEAKLEELAQKLAVGD